MVLTIKHFLSPQLFILFYLFVITNFFTLLTPFTFTSALSFNFTSFSNDTTDITYESAYSENQAIQLTGGNLTEWLQGRATYSKPLQLRDNATGKLTDFTTHFTFSISSRNQNVYGDGMTFFIIPNGSTIPKNAKGGALGLTSLDQVLNTSNSRFVAVEFDIFTNYWDPPGEHIGIDINSLKSKAYESWSSNITIREGKINEAWISYNSSSNDLCVAFTGFGDNVTVRQSLSTNVNLIDFLPDWVTFGFSAATGNDCAIHTIYSWYFSTSLEIVGLSPNSASGQGKENKLRFAFLVVFSTVVGFVFVVLILFVLWKRYKSDNDVRASDNHVVEEFPRGRAPREFSYDELAHATNNFNDEQILGRGGFGVVYRGSLMDSNSSVAVKKISEESRQGVNEYASEINVISRLRHRNLVELIGWCHERSRELLLVYEFMPNGSLDSHLYGEGNLLTWRRRYTIIKNLAEALLYLHEGGEHCVLHRDIKLSNIMLDSNFNAKLGDFGLARLVDHDKGSRTTTSAGTLGYMDPNYMATGKASKESDVYSFGIVALEIATGKSPTDQSTTQGLLKLVRELYKRRKVLEAADQRLGEGFDKQEMKCLLIVGLWCSHPNHKRRPPSIRQVNQVLECGGPLPDLHPLEMPSSTENETTSVMLSDGATSSMG
ncbi:L-type lectin-domain containing receptor kinase IX.1-like [Quercus robur]|uniref:L-type lectin-domain containing receptor kinase IX.1-like n=1 Tax=Quercus robur TaxID=38942 RepID=UPI0021633C55|nr:L-type lectin-domain containing receptor kinase IX.1-like [Quercus robur]